MPTDTYELYFSQTPFSSEDIARIMTCRGEHNRLGFAYQLAFVRYFNRFPAQVPLEIDEDVLIFASVQLRMDIQIHDGWQYGGRQKTVSEHQDAIRDYLDLRSFNTATVDIENFLFKEACQLEQMTALNMRLKAFLRTHNILEPSQDTINRLIQTQRENARNSIYKKLSDRLSIEERQCLDGLLSTDESAYSPLHHLKQPPGNPSPASFIKLTEILERIRKTGVLETDMSWLNNNFQRALARYARQCSLYRLKRLKAQRRYAVLVCFLWQLYQDTFDAAVQMHDKLINKIYNKADKEIDAYMKARRKHTRSSLAHYRTILGVLLNEEIDQEDIRDAVFKAVDYQTLKAERDAIEEMLSNNYSDSFKRVIARHSYLRQFAPALIKHITFQVDSQDNTASDIIEAVNLLNRMNKEGRHTLPDDAPTGFIPRKLRSFVLKGDKIEKPAWECALLTVLRDQVKSGNLYVPQSKRFETLETFFIPKAEWSTKRGAFFERAGLPANPDEVPAYLTDRLNRAYDRFLERLPDNQYAQLNEEGWKIASDPTEKLDNGTDISLNPLKEWLGAHIRTIKLPDLLIEVDNDLRFSNYFMPAADRDGMQAQHVCEVLATIMSHASETGPYTMSRITEGRSLRWSMPSVFWISRNTGETVPPPVVMGSGFPYPVRSCTRVTAMLLMILPWNFTTLLRTILPLISACHMSAATVMHRLFWMAFFIMKATWTSKSTTLIRMDLLTQILPHSPCTASGFHHELKGCTSRPYFVSTRKKITARSLSYSKKGTVY